MRSPKPILVLSAMGWMMFVLSAAGMHAQLEDVPPPSDTAPNDSTSEPDPDQDARQFVPPFAADGHFQDLVYLASQRPVFIRLNIRIRGNAFRSRRLQYARRLFDSLDLDHNQRLDHVEMRGIPPSIRLIPPRQPHEQPRNLDTAPVDANADELVTLQELIDYVWRSTGTAFVVTVPPDDSHERVQLFAAVDTNGDGILDRDETQSAVSSIRRFDRNDDEILEEHELSFNRRRRGTTRTRDSDDVLSRLLVVPHESDDPDATADGIFRRLVGQYDSLHTSGSVSNDTPTRDQKLHADELGISPEQLAAWDADGDGVLDAVEGRQFVLAPPHHLELSILFGEADDIVIENSRLPAPGEDAGQVTVERDEREGLELTLSGERFHLSMSPRLAALENFGRSYATYFDEADADNNEYLDAAELSRVGAIPSEFHTIDRDGDRLVREDEFREYGESQALLATCRIELLLARNAASILDFFDEDRNQRLPIREIQHAAERIAGWDVDGDGRIVPDEMPANNRLRLEFRETSIFRRNPIRRSPLTPVTNSATGPLWFQKMDRNRDGDLSPREFLGRMETFHRVDNDNDGLISETEATQADEPQSQQKN